MICALADGPMRCGALRRKVGGAAPKVLTGVLRALERDGAIVRRVYSRSPLRVARRNMTRVAEARARFDRKGPR